MIEFDIYIKDFSRGWRFPYRKVGKGKADKLPRREAYLYRELSYEYGDYGKPHRAEIVPIMPIDSRPESLPGEARYRGSGELKCGCVLSYAYESYPEGWFTVLLFPSCREHLQEWAERMREYGAEIVLDES